MLRQDSAKLPARQPGAKLTHDATPESEHAGHKNDPLNNQHPGAEAGEVIFKRGHHKCANHRPQQSAHPANDAHEHGVTRHGPVNIGERGELKAERIECTGDPGEKG